MNLSSQQINAVVATLEKEHNDKQEAKRKEQEKKGIAPKQTIKKLVASVTKELNSLSVEARRAIETGISFTEYNRKTKMQNVVPVKSFDVQRAIEDYMEEDAEAKIPVDGSKPFDKDEIKRQVVMASIESKDVSEILKKMGKKS